VTDRMAAGNEFVREMACALARPRQRRLRVATGDGFEQGLQITQEPGTLLTTPRATGPRLADPSRCRIGSWVAQFPESPLDGRACQSGSGSYGGDTATTETVGLTSSPAPAHPFVHQRSQPLELLLEGGYHFLSDHLVRCTRANKGYVIRAG